ncbi:MAG: agmatinase family protein [Chloroflexota bacterium]|nr:agmatinase family protein [Chloroflexota bacterium]
MFANDHATWFGSRPTFAGLPPESSRYETARAVVLSAPYDATTTFRGGTRDGPRAIVDASRELELYDLELACEIATVGIHTTPELEPHLGDPRAMVHRVRQAVAALLADGKFPLLLGGEHTLTAGAIAACATTWPDLAVLYVDAHADVRGPYLGARYNHASALRLALEDAGLKHDQAEHDQAEHDEAGHDQAGHAEGGYTRGVVAVGVRSMAQEEATYIRDTGLAVVGAERIAATRRDAPGALERLWAETLAHLGPPGGPLYVSVDLDALDPGIMPAVGTPEPGGLDWYEAVSLLRAASRRHPIVMADVMELAPGEGPVASAFTAAKLAYKLIGYALVAPDRARLAHRERGTPA